MSVEVHRPIRFAIAHCFTTHSKGAILQVICKRYYHDRGPQTRDWIVNPGFSITRRVYERSGISTKEAQKKPSLKEVRGDIVKFFADLDVIFVCDLSGEKNWFDKIIFHGITSPLIVDLIEKYKYFLPERHTPYSDNKIISLTNKGQSGPKIYQVLGGMTRMLDDILQAILIRMKIEEDPYNYPVFSLLDWALSSRAIDESFYSIYSVASQAYKIQWVSGQIAETAYDAPKLMSRDQLERYVIEWKAPDLIEQGRTPYDESIKVGGASGQTQSHHSAKMALEILRFLAASQDEAETVEILEGFIQTVEALFRDFEVHLFKLSNLLMEAIYKNDKNGFQELSTKCKTITLEITENLTMMADVSDHLLSRIQSTDLWELLSNDCIDEIVVIKHKSQSVRKSFENLHEQIPEWIEASPTDLNAQNSLKKQLRFVQELGKEFHLGTVSIQDEFFGHAMDLLSDRKKFEERPEQKQYSEYIKDTINIGGTYAIEAGTGTGKTLGYLIPACEHVRINKNRQVIVATATNNLTDQIVTKEWQTITAPRDSLYHDLKIAILKGRNNYLCVTAVIDLFKEFNQEISFTIMKENWRQSQKLEVHTADTLLLPTHRPAIINHVVKDGHQLLGESALSLVQENQTYQVVARANEEINGLLLFQDAEERRITNLLIQRGKTTSYWVRLNSEPKEDVEITIIGQCAGVTINLHDYNDSNNVTNEHRIAWLYLFLTLSRKEGRWENSAEFYRKYGHMEMDPVDAESQCKQGVCSRWISCTYPQALTKAQNANIVITNHHKLAMLDVGIQKRASVCILDEADQFPDNLRSALTETLKSKDIKDFTKRLLGAKRRRGFVKIFEERAKKIDSMDRYKESLQGIEQACHQVNEHLRAMTGVDSKEKEIRWKDLNYFAQNTMKKSLEAMEGEFAIIASGFTRILRDKDPKIHSELVKRLKIYKDEAYQIRTLITGIIKATEGKKYFVTYTQREYTWDLDKIPFNIGAHVNDLVRNYQTVIFTSATLQVSGSTDLFELELLDYEARCPPFTGSFKIDSPFIYDKQVNAAVTPYIPEYDYKKAPNHEFYRKALETIILLSVAIEGRTLVLFVSRAEMKQIYEIASPILAEYQIPLLIQDESGSSEAIIEAFSDMEESVLFGVNRFWTGADFPGKTLSQLMIVRLPNAPLGRPMVKERKDRWSYDRWGLWYSGNTCRSLRQGFGRLIRRKNDSGLFVVLDYRIKTNFNMQTHQTAIPVSLESKFNSALELASWGVKKLGLSPELKQREIKLETVYEFISQELCRPENQPKI